MAPCYKHVTIHSLAQHMYTYAEGLAIGHRWVTQLSRGQQILQPLLL